jgi:antirestriction protein ArdC
VSNADVYQRVTDIVKAKLQQGIVPWRQPWSAVSGRPVSMSTGNPYNGVNVLLLGLDAAEKGYTSPWWGTFSQIAERAGMEQRHGKRGNYWASPDDAPRGVRRGEHGTRIVLAKRVKVNDVDPVTKEVTRKTVPLLRFFTVFNAEQADGLPERYYPKAETRGIEEIPEPQEVLDAYLANGGPSLHHVPGGDRANFNWQTDIIQLPEREQFASANAYYATAFHEAGHSTGHKDRLNREPAQHLGGWKFGDKTYAREELVAEMTSALLQATTGIESEEQLDQSASYIDDWMGALDKDPQLVSHAASQAGKAADLILGQRQAEHEEEPEAEEQPQRQAA